MAPKEAAGTKDALFLATCFKHLKQKPQVDTAAVAGELKMSDGGVRNKLRPIMKGFEEEGACWLQMSPLLSKQARGGEARSKAKLGETNSQRVANPATVDPETTCTPKRKSAANAEDPAESAESASKLDGEANGADAGVYGTTSQSLTPSKKVKTAPCAADEGDSEACALTKSGKQGNQ